MLNATFFVPWFDKKGGKHSAEPPLWKQDRPCTAPPTNLVYLSIGAISNYLHQLEYPSWILERGEKGRKVFQFKVMSFKKKKIVQATLCTVSQLLRPGLPYMPNASRTKEKQTLATPRYGSAVIFNTSSLTRRAGSNLLLLQVTLNDGGLNKNQSKLKRKYIYIYKFKTFKKTTARFSSTHPQWSQVYVY